MTDSDHTNGRNLPRKGPIMLPDYYFYSGSEIPVRFFETPSGGLDAECFNLKTQRIERAIWLIAEIYFNPGTSTDVERVSEAVYDQRVAELQAAVSEKGKA